MNNNTISSDAYKSLLAAIHPDVKVLDLYVRNNFLTAELSSGVLFSVKNKRID